MTDSDARQDAVVAQTTLTGEKSVRRDCEVIGFCQNPAKYEIEPFCYDGGGWVYVTKAACESCTREYLEPENKTWEDDVRTLKPSERWADAE